MYSCHELKQINEQHTENESGELLVDFSTSTTCLRYSRHLNIRHKSDNNFRGVLGICTYETVIQNFYHVSAILC